VEHIKQALSKAKSSLDQNPDDHRPLPHAEPAAAATMPGTEKAPEAPKVWTPRRVELNPRLMARNRIVSFDMSHPNHVAFNLLRTRVRKIQHDNRWKTIAVTSPTPACGKTMVALNLAFSLARAADTRVTLIDLDLKRPAIARTLGIKPTGSIGQFLRGNAEANDCFVEVGPNLAIGLNADHIQESSELIHSPLIGKLIDFINLSLAPNIILFDLPPMRTCDDALAFMPHADAAFLVAAAGKTTVPELNECEQQIVHLNKFVGVVLNKSEETREDYYY